MPDYQKGQIYTIRYRLDDSLLYVGSTSQPLHKRWQDHKDKHNNIKHKEYDYLLYQKIRETNDIKNWYIELYEVFPCNNRKELNKKEGEIIRLLNANLNKVIPGRTQKEYREEHKEQISIMKQEWYQNNLDKVKASRERNKEKYREYDRERSNTETRKEYNRLRGREKASCECGCVVTKNTLSHHKKTLKHKILMESKSED